MSSSGTREEVLRNTVRVEDPSLIILNQLRLINLVPGLSLNICLVKVKVLRQQLITQVPDSPLIRPLSQRIKVCTTVGLAPASAFGPRACFAFQSGIGGTKYACCG